MKDKHRKTNARGDVLLSPQWIPKEYYDYIKATAKKRRVYMVTVINEAIRNHKEQSEGKSS